MNEPVCIAPPSLSPDDEHGLVPILRQRGWRLRFLATSAGTTAHEVIDQLRDCRVVVAGGEPYTHEVFAALPRLEHVARFGVGFDAVDVEEATRHGVVVSVTPGAMDDAVADHAIALMFALARRLGSLDRSVRAGQWQGAPGADVWGATMGIIGLGRIGRAVARRARGLNMRICAHELQPDDTFVAEYGIKLVSLEQLLRESDFVSLHTPVTPDTAELINAGTLALMKPTAYIINTARGGLIDEEALYGALVNGGIAGAGLDTRAQEPPSDPRMAKLDNVVSTPHCAAITPRSFAAVGRMVLRNIDDVSARRKPDTLLNPDVWDRFLQRQRTQP